MPGPPETGPGGTGLQFEYGQVPVAGESLEVPGVAGLEDFLVEASASDMHPGDGAAIAVAGQGIDLDDLAENQLRGEGFRFPSEGLVLFGTVDAIETDLDGPAFMTNGDRVSVGNSADAPGPPLGREGREKQKDQDGQEEPQSSLHAFSIGCKPPYLILLPCTLQAA